MNAIALYGQLSAAVLFGAGITFLPISRRREAGSLAALVAVFTFAPQVFGLIGPPSLTLTQLAVFRLLKPERDLVPGTIAPALLVAFAALFYPLALGVGTFDPFDLGYRPQLLLALLVPIGVWLAWRGQRTLLMLIGLDLVAYGFGLFDNLWSACFDPILVLLGVVRLARIAIDRYRMLTLKSIPQKQLLEGSND